MVRVEVTFDDFPEEFGMTLFHTRGDVVRTIVIGAFANKTFASLPFLLEPDAYDLLIRDSGRNGLCCDHGSGFIEIYAELDEGDYLLATSDGQYEDKADLEFFVDSTPMTATLPPMGVTGDGEINVQLAIALDNFPSEVSMQLEDDTGQVLQAYETGFFLVRNGHFSQTFNLNAGTYSLVVADRFGDGICCVSGVGNITISTVEDGGVTQILAFSNGDYGSGTTLRFVVGDGTLTPTVSASPSGPPIPAPVATSTVATPYPTMGAIGDGEINVQLAIVFDDFPSEVFMSLEDEAGQVFHSYEAGFFMSSGNFSQAFNLNEGIYFLVVADSLGDGICCLFGAGSITISSAEDGVERVVAFSDGNYGHGTTLRFAIGNTTLSPTASFSPSTAPVVVFSPYPTMAPLGDGDATIRIEVLLDVFPWEFSMTLFRDVTNTTVQNYPSGFFSSAGLFVQHFNLNSGAYRLEVADAAIDGICCLYGLGTIAVYLESSVMDTPLAFSNGTYGAGTTLSFVVPDDTLMVNPSSAPMAMVSTQTTFSPSSESTRSLLRRRL